MVRVIPGVEINVVKEIVPQQLYPAGVAGMIGTSKSGPIGSSVTVTSYREFCEFFGPEEQGYTLHKEVKKAFLNGVFQVVATMVGSSYSSPSSGVLQGGKKKDDIIKLTSRGLGEQSNKIQVKVMKGKTENTARVEISDKSRSNEEFENLSMVPNDPLFIVKVINESSRIVTAEMLSEEPSNDVLPFPQEISLTGGKMGAPSKSDYEKALEQLELETNIDLVYVCDNWDPEIHALVDAHCQNMSTGKEPKPLGPRIGVGTVSPNEGVSDIIKRTEVLASDRFILVAPYGVAGAVTGLLSKLNYYESPTFKPLTGIANIEKRYTPSEQMKLLTNGILPVDAVRGRGIIIVKGITTSKEQASVMRIADRAVRGTKNVADLFVGTLNTASNRMALKERITELLINMEKESAIVPSTDGEKPAFLVDVYSSQSDFAQGIVRTDIAVRPVRAMDYIYATINVQAY